MSTMAEVAREAGVSITTVSHVLNGTRHVNEKTVARVRAAIDRIGYRPHSIARALAGARTQSIGVAMSGISNPYLIDVISAIESEAAKHDHWLLLGDTHDEPERELQMVQELVQRRVDGLILVPSAGAETNALRYLATQSLPVVLVDRFLPVDVDQVGTENEEPTARLVEHLASIGHRRIAHIAGLEGLSTIEERINGYRTGLHRSGLPIDDLVAYGAPQYDPAKAAVQNMLDAADPPTAMVSGNNSTTIRVLRALRERGLTVPGDMALVAFDDFEWSDLFHPRLTVIAQPTREIGQKAVQLLLARLDNPDRPAESVRMPATFIHRESCGCVRSVEPRIGQ
jgi:LacI family transcriptional regulator, galactose operon repressor